MFRNWCLVRGQEKVPWPGDPLQSGQRWDLQELEAKAQLRMLCGGIRCGCFKKLEKGIIQGKKIYYLHCLLTLISAQSIKDVGSGSVREV